MRFLKEWVAPIAIGMLYGLLMVGVGYLASEGC